MLLRSDCWPLRQRNAVGEIVPDKGGELVEHRQPRCLVRAAQHVAPRGSMGAVIVDPATGVGGGIEKDGLCRQTGLPRRRGP